METKEKSDSKAVIAVIRIRGDVGLNPHVRKTFELMRLYRKNYCIVVKNTPNSLAMIQRIKDFTTFGELSKDMFVKLVQSRGKLAGEKALTEAFLKEKTKLGFKEFADAFYDSKIDLKAVPSLKQFFRLHPPIGGFERGGIKSAFAQGGVLGYRGPKIDKLVERMIK